MTESWNILHASRNTLMFNRGDSNTFISLIHSDRLSYIPLKSFAPVYRIESILTGSNGNILKGKSWKEVRSIIDKFHKHTCGHSTITDIRLLLERNDLCNADVEQYMNKLCLIVRRENRQRHPNQNERYRYRTFQRKLMIQFVWIIFS